MHMGRGGEPTKPAEAIRQVGFTIVVKHFFPLICLGSGSSTLVSLIIIYIIIIINIIIIPIVAGVFGFVKSAKAKNV